MNKLLTSLICAAFLASPMALPLAQAQQQGPDATQAAPKKAKAAKSGKGKQTAKGKKHKKKTVRK